MGGPVFGAARWRSNLASCRCKLLVPTSWQPKRSCLVASRPRLIGHCPCLLPQHPVSSWAASATGGAPATALQRCCCSPPAPHLVRALTRAAFPPPCRIAPRFPACPGHAGWQGASCGPALLPPQPAPQAWRRSRMPPATWQPASSSAAPWLPLFLVSTGALSCSPPGGAVQYWHRCMGRV